MKDGSIGIVKKIIRKKNRTLIMIQKFCYIAPLFEDPIDSTVIGTYRVKELGKINTINASQIKCKMVKLPHLNHWVAIRLY